MKPWSMSVSMLQTESSGPLQPLVLSTGMETRVDMQVSDSMGDGRLSSG